MSFFIKKSTTKRKRIKEATSSVKPAVSKDLSNEHDDVFDFSSDEASDKEAADYLFSDEEETYITAQEKKVKLAKKYLKEIEEQEKEKLLNGEGPTEEQILRRLTEDELSKAGKLKRKVAGEVEPDLSEQKELKCSEHGLSITCIAISADDKTLYSASKDASIVKWNLINMAKVCSIFAKRLRKKSKRTSNEIYHYHSATVNCLAVSADNKYLVSGDEKGIINVWNSENLDFIHTFRGHKKSVTGVAICRETNFLYSASYDALVKVWTLNELSYVETLYGHQNKITSIDVLQKDRVVTSGGLDRTIRVWKVDEESQLIFHGQQGSIDMVKRLDNNQFVSGGDDGILSLWSVLKKKPLFNVINAHGLCKSNSEPNWISCVCTLHNSDLLATGSCDGFVRLWKCAESGRSLSSIATIPVVGFVNSMQFSHDGKQLIIAVSKEHRLGRWECIDEAKNRIIIVPLTLTK